MATKDENGTKDDATAPAEPAKLRARVLNTHTGTPIVQVGTQELAIPLHDLSDEGLLDFLGGLSELISSVRGTMYYRANRRWEARRNALAAIWSVDWNHPATNLKELHPMRDHVLAALKEEVE